MASEVNLMELRLMESPRGWERKAPSHNSTVLAPEREAHLYLFSRVVLFG